jgi:excisionase family DNA binding protein
MRPNIPEQKRRALSPREAEHALGISHASLFRLLKSGRLKRIKVGSRTLIPVAAIDALLNEGGQ